MGANIIRRGVVLVVALGSLGIIFGPAGQAMAASPVKITAAYFQVSGVTTPPTNSQLNQEYIVIRNGGTRAVKLTGGTLRDLARPTTPSHVFKFPAFKLGSGKTVRIHTGRGSNTSTNLYWGLTYFVWGDDSDTATLKTATGTTVSKCSWTSLNSSPKYC